MTRLAMRAVVIGGLCVAACAGPALLPGKPRVVDRLAIAPYATHEQCADLHEGQRVDFRYESSAPVDFDIRYAEGNAVVSPLVRSHSEADEDIFEVRVPAQYCLHWQAGADGAILRYRVLVRDGR